MHTPAADPSQRSPSVSLLACITLCFLIGFIGSQGAFQGLQAWYQVVNKPSFAPPAWIFAPIWTVLFGLIGLALWLVWRSEPSKARQAGLIFFAIQLLLHALWCWTFFAWHKLPVASIAMALTALATLIALICFRKVRGTAAWLLAPHLAWCLFATLLSFGTWRMNPTIAPATNNEIRIDLGER